MDNNELKEIFFNRTDVKNAERLVCDNCFEHIVFLLCDTQNRKFSIGLQTILECLMFAISNGDLPKLPASWLDDVDHTYNTDFSNIENISYYDEHTYKERFQKE